MFPPLDDLDKMYAVPLASSSTARVARVAREQDSSPTINNDNNSNHYKKKKKRKVGKSVPIITAVLQQQSIGHLLFVPM